MHVWGDDWFKLHGQEFDEAAMWLENFWRSFGLLAYAKEKFGTMRGYVCFVHKYDLPWFLRWTGIHIPIRWYQEKLYNVGYQLLCKKYPHFIPEIMFSPDYP